MTIAPPAPDVGAIEIEQLETAYAEIIACVEHPEIQATHVSFHSRSCMVPICTPCAEDRQHELNQLKAHVKSCKHDHSQDFACEICDQIVDIFTIQIREI